MVELVKILGAEPSDRTSIPGIQVVERTTLAGCPLTSTCPGSPPPHKCNKKIKTGEINSATKKLEGLLERLQILHVEFLLSG